jgi:hypothetical protein
MTTGHVHDWQPMPLERGRFVCACGASGYRAEFGPNKGKIVPHKQTQKGREQTMHVGAANMGATTGHARRGKRGPGSY